MKNGAEYARRVKALFTRLQRAEGDAQVPPPTDPMEQLAISVLGSEAGQAQGRKAYRRLTDRMVDINEIRVSPPGEVARIIKDVVPDSNDRAKALVDALNAVFHSENAVTLERLRTLGLREARAYLESLGGVDPYSVASVILWSLGGHAVPVNQRLLEVLREDDLVAPECDVAEVQSFFERHVSAADARHFCDIMEKYASQHGRTAIPDRSVSRTKSNRTNTRKSARKSVAKARKARAQD